MGQPKAVSFCTFWDNWGHFSVPIFMLQLHYILKKNIVTKKRL